MDMRTPDGARAALGGTYPAACLYMQTAWVAGHKATVQNLANACVRTQKWIAGHTAAEIAGKMPADFRVSITNAPGKGVYPISSFTWILLYQNPADKARAKIMVDFMKWALADGQKDASPLGYAPLPKEVVDLEAKALEKIQL